MLVFKAGCAMRYFLWFWYKVIGQAAYIINSRKKETQRAYVLLEEIEKKFNGKFNVTTKRKIAVSYGIYNPMICDAFTRLYGRRTNEAEKERYIHYFICSSLFDDFTDYELINEKQLEAISFQTNDYVPKSFDEMVFLHSHRKLREYVKDKHRYDQVSHALFDAQMKSKQQHHATLNPDEIQQITFAKGGNSVLLCSFYLDEKTDENTYRCWYKIGTLIQLTNDLYDIYKDLQDHISTLPNKMVNAYSFEQFFISGITEMKSLIAQLPCSAEQRKEFSLSMAGIYAFGLIALDQLKKIQGSADQLPDLNTLSRKALVIDMEKLSNLAKWFKFVYRYAKI